MTNAQGQLQFTATLSSDQAWEIAQKKAPLLERVEQTLLYHPFAGFEYAFSVPRLRSKLRRERVNTLVDRYTGKAFITGPWSELQPIAMNEEARRVKDPGWNSTTFETARSKASRLVGTVAMRHLRLAQDPRVEETRSYELLWKPNWLLTGRLQDRTIQILVDGLNGDYYVVGS